LVINYNVIYYVEFIGTPVERQATFKICAHAEYMREGFFTLDQYKNSSGRNQIFAR
jgi:hypothetical protein